MLSKETQFTSIADANRETFYFTSELTVLTVIPYKSSQARLHRVYLHVWFIWFGICRKVLATPCNPFFPIGINKFDATSTTVSLFWIKPLWKGSANWSNVVACWLWDILDVLDYLLSVHMAATQASHSYLSIAIAFLTYRRVTYSSATSFLT